MFWKRKEKTPEFPGFKKCIEMLKSPDAWTYEDGYHWLEPRANEFLDQLIEMMTAANNSDFRAKLIELIGDSKNPRIIPYLQAELSHSDIEVRRWAFNGLKNLRDAQADIYVQDYRVKHPEDEFD